MKKTIYILSASLLVGITLSFLFFKPKPDVYFGATSYKINPFTGELDRVDTSSGGGSTTTLTATQVAFGSPDSTVTSSPNLTFNSSTNQLKVTNVSSTSITSTNIYAFGTTTAPCFTNDGVTCITSGGSTSPGGSNTQVQYNNNGAFAGDAGLTFNSTTNRLTVDGVVSSTGLVLNAETLNDFTGTGLQITAGALELTTPYQDGSAYDSRFVNVTGGDSMEGRLTINGGSPGGLYIYSESEDTPSANGIYAGYSPDGTGRTKIELSGSTESYIDFTDTGLDYEGRIYYDQATNVLSFYANGQQTMRIDDTSLYATSTNFGLIIMGGDTVNDFTGLNLEVVGNALSVVDDPTFATTTVTGGFFQTGMPDCDNSITSKLLYDITTGKYSCGTDQTGGGGSTSVTETLVPYGGVGNTLASSTSFYFTSSTNTLSVDRISATGIQATTISTTIFRSPAVTISIGPTDGMSLLMSSIFNTITPASDNFISLGSNALRFNDVFLYDLFGFNVTTTNLAVTGTFSGVDGSFTNITSTNGNFPGLTFTKLNGTNATSTNFFATNGTFTRSTSTNFFATNGSFTSITSTNLSFTRAVGTNVTSTNLSISGLTSLAGLTFTNATGTGQFRIATTTITGGFFQTDLANCNADTETVSYNATTGKFGCGDDDSGGASTVSTTNANGVNFTDVSPASFADNNTTELWNDATRPNITPQSANNPVIINVNYMLRGASATDNDFVIRVVRENDPGSTTPTCDLTSDVQVGASSSGGSLISAFTTNLTDIQSANGMLIDFPATTTAVYYTICTSASSTVSAAPTSSVLHVGLSELQGSGGGTSREFTRIVTSTGSSAWTKPVTSTGFTGAIVWCVGGGGGGGGAGTDNTIGGGGAGGGGSYRYLSALDLSSTSSVNVTVGAGGAGGSAGNNSGTAGGTSSFSTFITCSGGAAGVAANAAETTAAGGAGSGGSVNGTGGYGGPNGANTDSWRGYGGAACVNQNWSSTIQDAFSPNVTPGGILGQWCGAGAPRPPSWSAVDYTGGQGASFGAGGSGGQRVTGSVAGADGRQGVIVIIEQYQ